MSETRFKDSGERQSFTTGAVRDLAQNKGAFDLIPPFALLHLSMVYEIGAKKYASRNWEKGIPIMRFIGSGLRHIFKYVCGLRDEPHLSMACWNFMCALQTASWVQLGLRDRSLNDLPNHLSSDPSAKAEVLSKLELEYLVGWAQPGGLTTKEFDEAYAEYKRTQSPTETIAKDLEKVYTGEGLNPPMPTKL